MAKKPQLAIDTRPWRDPSAKPFVRIRNVSKKFGDVSAVHEVSLDIYKSELFCLLGGSSSGKSTLLRMLGRLRAADFGHHRNRRPGHDRGAALPAAGQHDVPVLRAVPAYECRAEHRLWPEAR